MRTPRLLLLSVLAATALTACSGDDEPGTALSDPPAPTASPTAAQEPSAEPEPEPSEENVGPPRPTEAQLTGDGIFASDEVIEFGTPIAQARPLLEGELGKATLDTGVGSNNAAYGVCPGTKLQALEFGGGGLVVLFGDVGGPGLRMYGWALQDKGSPSAVPQASALVGDVSTYEFGLGTAVQELQEVGAEVKPADEPFAASFTLMDQSSGFFGFLTGTSPTDTVTFVQAGEACGE